MVTEDLLFDWYTTFTNVFSGLLHETRWFSTEHYMSHIDIFYEFASSALVLDSTY